MPLRQTCVYFIVQLNEGFFKFSNETFDTTIAKLQYYIKSFSKFEQYLTQNSI